MFLEWAKTRAAVNYYGRVAMHAEQSKGGTSFHQQSDTTLKKESNHLLCSSIPFDVATDNHAGLRGVQMVNGLCCAFDDFEPLVPW